MSPKKLNRTETMTNKINHITAYILAGGKSFRMGTDKGMILFNGKLLIENVIEQLNPLFNKITIISNNPEYKRFRLEVIEDLIKDIGPAGGIQAALSDTLSDKVFIVSCDTPFITTDAIQFIIKQSGKQQIILPFHQGKIQPLFGIYSRVCLKKWVQLIEQKIIKLQEMVTHFDLLKIDVTNNPSFNDLLFTNVNDQHDLNKALQQL